MHKPSLLPFELGRKQSHLGLPMIRSSTTMNWLEERLDRSCPATHHPLSPWCCKSTFHTKTSQQTTKRTCPILHRTSSHLPRRSNAKTRWQHRRPKQDPTAILQILPSIQWRSFTQIPTIKNMGPHNQTQTRSPSVTTWKTNPFVTGQTQGITEIHIGTP